MRFVDGALEGEREPLVAVGLGGRPGETQVVGEGEQPLLRAVVQVALEAPPSGVSCLDDPGARSLQVVELRQHLGLEPLVLDRKPRPGADLPRKLLCGEVATRVTDQRDLPSVTNDRSDDAPLPPARWRNGVPSAVDEAPRPVERVRHLDIGVAEACRQRGAKRSRCRRLSEIVGEPCNGRAGSPNDVCTPAEGARERRRRCRPGEEERGERGH